MRPNRRIECLHMLVLLILIALPATSFAQFQNPPSVESGGRATVKTPPSYVEITLEMQATAVNLAESTERVLRFEEGLSAAFQDLDLTPTSVEMSGVELLLIDRPHARIAARVRFDFASNSSAEDRAKSMASWMDRIRKACASLKGTVEGYSFGVSDRVTSEQEAVARATENALANADVVGSLMDVNIVALQSAHITSVDWSEVGDTAALECTAQVRVVYTLSVP